jgi:hypothetical protein
MAVPQRAGSRGTTIKARLWADIAARSRLNYI